MPAVSSVSLGNAAHVSPRSIARPRFLNATAPSHRGQIRSAAVSMHLGLPPKRERNMIYEVRIFSCNPGRLPALLHLFETHVLKIWDKHGIEQVGFWTVLVGDGSNDLHCCIAWKSLVERERKWTEFEADPKWISARDKSNKKGPILANIDSVFLKPTSFSAMK